MLKLTIGDVNDQHVLIKNLPLNVKLNNKNIYKWEETNKKNKVNCFNFLINDNIFIIAAKVYSIKWLDVQLYHLTRKDIKTLDDIIKISTKINIITKGIDKIGGNYSDSVFIYKNHFEGVNIKLEYN